MPRIVRCFALLIFLSLGQSAYASWADDWAARKKGDESAAFQACHRLAASGGKSDIVYFRLAQLYEKRYDLIVARELYLAAYEINPSNQQANLDYLRLANDPNLALQEMSQKHWLKQLFMQMPK